MAATAGIIAAVTAAGSTAYGAISANQRDQDAKGVAKDLVKKAPNAGLEAAKAAEEANKAAAEQRAKALNQQGYADTILTGGSGLPGFGATGKGKATLLGL